MKFFDLIKLIFDNLGRRKGRVVLTAIGVVIGTASVIVLVSLAIGLQQSATSNLYGIGDLTRIDVYPNYDYGNGGGGMVIMGGGGGGGSTDSGMKLLTPSVLKEIESLPNVAAVIPRDYLNAQAMISFGKMQNWGSIMGIGRNDLSIFEYELDGGTDQLERGTTIIGGWMAKNWFDPNQRPGQENPEQPDVLGQMIRVTLTKYTSDGQMVEKTVSLRVVGVLKEMRSEADSTMLVRLDELTAWNEWANGKRINRNKDGYQNVIVKATDAKTVVELAEKINEMGFMASTPQQYVQSINSFFVILQLIFGGVGAISLLVAAIGIANTMTMAILERTREIGLMKAIGATNNNVLSIFLGESAGIGLIGGIGGVILGWGGSAIINVIMVNYLNNQAAQNGGMPTTTLISTPLWLPIFALLFSTIVGLLSGLYPSLRAATLVPVNALKYE